MTRDYKHASATRKKDKPKPTPGWVWLLSGALITLLLVETVPKLWHRIGARHAIHQLLSTSKQPHTKSKSQPSKTKPAGQTKNGLPTHFDFYKMLPNFQVVIPSQDKEVHTGDEPGPVQQPGTYFLQVGSFQNYNEADKLRASLALIGVVSNIQTVKVDNGQTWNRVRVGPIRDLAKLNAIRRKLRDNRIEPLLVRVSQ